MIFIAIGREAVGEREVDIALGDEQQDEGRESRAEELRHPIGAELLPGEAAGGGEAKRHGRIEMAARNRAEGVSAGQHRKAEGQRDAEKADAELWKAGGNHGAATPAKNKPESSQKFGEKFV